MKTTAVAVVSRVKKVPAPELPKTVELEPPKTAPMSAPFPVCSNTTRIRKMQDKIWTMVMTVNIWGVSPENGD